MGQSLRLGIFIVGALAAFGGGVFWIGNREFRFNSTYRLNAEFQNVAGLADGAEVRVGGIREGTVRLIALPEQPDQKVRVEMDLRAATRNVIRKDSLAMIKTEGLVGDQYVEITFGSKGAQEVQNGDAISAEAPLEISDMLKKTNAMLDSAQDAIQSIGQTAENLQGISAKLNSGRGTVGALVNDRSVYEHVNEAVTNLAEDTEALKHNFFLRGFFKRRGYEDSAELMRNAIQKLPAGAPENRLTLNAGKLFDKPESAEIKDGKLLNDPGRYLEQTPYGLAVIAAYADQKGDSDKQRELTQARAAVVREYLAQHFKLDDTRIRTFGGGKSADAPEGGEIDILVYPASAGSRTGEAARSDAKR
jgi:phospholipid/cholesterol/gamma-HCH transport system substrate-binding protein